MLEEADLWDPQEMRTGTREGCHGCSTAELGLNLGVESRGKEREGRCAEGSLPGFLAVVACGLAGVG